MVASFDKALGSVTFLSIPRDLYVTTPTYRGKINSLFAHEMLIQKKDAPNRVDIAARNTITTIEKITDLDIPYYATVSFDGFVNFVDELDGLMVDVPTKLIDNQFPDKRLK